VRSHFRSRARSRAAGFGYHLLKPVDPESLQTIISLHPDAKADGFADQLQHRVEIFLGFSTAWSCFTSGPA
jgi:hypothetical protein